MASSSTRAFSVAELEDKPKSIVEMMPLRYPDPDPEQLFMESYFEYIQGGFSGQYVPLDHESAAMHVLAEQGTTSEFTHWLIIGSSYMAKPRYSLMILFMSSPQWLTHNFFSSEIVQQNTVQYALRELGFSKNMHFFLWVPYPALYFDGSDYSAYQARNGNKKSENSKIGIAISHQLEKYSDLY